MSELLSQIETFHFRNLHPNLSMGTASDRYTGWIGQIYSPEKYMGRITSRQKSVARKKFREEVLPVECVLEYFEHFNVLELDFTFYRPLLDHNSKATPTFHNLSRYRDYLKDNDRLILKAPQIISARNLRKGNNFIRNDSYLNPEIFVKQFFKPAEELLGPRLRGIIFEQEYQRKQDRLPQDQFTDELDTFFRQIPKDNRYHIEIRTDKYLSDVFFHMIETHGIGQVLSNWTWLPPLPRQFTLSGKRILNTAKHSIIRLMTPLGVRYENAYAMAHPFNALIEGMLKPRDLKETVALVQEIIRQKKHVNVIINNRYGGNAPLVAQKMAQQFLRILK